MMTEVEKLKTCSLIFVLYNNKTTGFCLLPVCVSQLILQGEYMKGE